MLCPPSVPLLCPVRILYKLDELVRPYVHKILVVIEPLLIDEDYYARVEGREIIANLSKAAGKGCGAAAVLVVLTVPALWLASCEQYCGWQAAPTSRLCCDMSLV